MLENPYIREYQVVEPPTSEELEIRAVEALSNSRVLSLMIRENREVPKPETESAAFLIRQTLHPSEGGMVIRGEGLADTPEENNRYTAHANPDKSEPASLTIVT